MYNQTNKRKENENPAWAATEKHDNTWNQEK